MEKPKGLQLKLKRAGTVINREINHFFVCGEREKERGCSSRGDLSKSKMDE